MATEAIRLSAVVPATPRRIFDAWLDSATHGAMTNTEVSIDPQMGGKFTAGNGTITGETLWVEPARLIVQSWRSREFPEEAIDSRLEVHLEATEGGTRVVIDHRDLPLGQGEDYERAWNEGYLEPMKRWFAENPGEAEVEAAEPEDAWSRIEEIEQETAKPARKRATTRRKSAPRATAGRTATGRKGTRTATGTRRKTAPKAGATARTARATKATARTTRATKAGTTTRRAAASTRSAGAAKTTARTTGARKAAATTTGRRTTTATTTSKPRRAAAATTTGRRTTTAAPARERRTAGPAAKKATTRTRRTPTGAARKPAAPRRPTRKPRS